MVSEDPVIRELIRRVREAEANEFDLPHVLVCFDLVTGEVAYSGPYPTALDAIRAADVEERFAAFDPAAELRFMVARIGDPLQIC